MSNHQRNQYAGNNDQSGTQDHFTVYIRDMLSGVPATKPEHSIFRVRHQLREVNEKAYEPGILAIGPYHNGNDKFKFMDVQKLQYLKKLHGRNEGSVNRCMTILSNLEQQARDCYAETIVLSREKFLAMMLIDGCFIVELFRKHKIKDLRDEGDPVMEAGWIRICLRRDLLLLENQIPFFILNELYERTKGPEERSELIDVATRYFHFKLGDSSQRKTLHKSKHLLNLMHTCWTSDLPDRLRPNHRTTRPENDLVFVSSAMKLRESGVRFKVAAECQPIRHSMDIKFKDGILEIPVFIVEDHTESHYRNLIAYEQHRQGRDINYYTDYVAFMDCLINSSKDVERLCRAGIIHNYLGDDEVVAKMFNKMGDYVTLSNFYYKDVFDEVNGHFRKRRNRWIAKLRREHLRSPWALLSIFAATLLLLLTVAQTVFSVLSYGKDKKD